MTSEEIAVALQDHENEIKSLKHRMDDQEKKEKILTELTTSVKTLAVNMEYMAKEQEKQGERLKRLEQEPVETQKYYKRTAVSCVITGIMSAIVGAVMTFIISGGIT